MIRTVISFALVAYALYKVFQKHAQVQATKPAAQLGPQSITGAPPSSAPEHFFRSSRPILARPPIAINNRW